MENTEPNQLNDFITGMQKPKEQIEAPPFSFDDEPEIISEESTGEESNDYAGNYRDEAMVIIHLLDSGVGLAGMAISGMAPERYQKFAKSSPPPYYIDATARLVEKYSLQNVMSPEAVFLVALAGIYSSTISTAISDRTMMAKKAREEAVKKERDKMREEIALAKEVAKRNEETKTGKDN